MSIPSGMLKTVTEGFKYWHFIVMIAVLLLIHVAIIVWRLHKGNEAETRFLWGLIGPIKFLPSEKIRVLEKAYFDLECEYKKVLSVAQQKSNVIKLLGELNREIERLNQPALPNAEFEKLFEKVLDFILPGVITILTGATSNMLRIALLTKQESGELRIYKGCGYNTEEQERFRSSIVDTVSRTVFLSGNSLYIPDITDDSSCIPTTKESDTYHSLFCTPIGHYSRWGVLSISAKDVDSFSIDDQDCIKYIAQALSVIFEIQNAIKGGAKETIGHGEGTTTTC